ncbi:MAG: acyl-CoA dehydrogenase family protein [Bdellovibrionales bacterium]|nr:acyl-CoA dehydrogenase family protein [Bdellovibrionales bacterium]
MASGYPLIWSDAFFTPDHTALAEAAREFANREIRPAAARIDEKHEFPKEIIQQMGAMGFLGMMVDPEFGGAGLDTMSYVAVMEEIAVACASTSVIMSVNNSLACAPIANFGTLAQKQEFLAPLARGEKLGCYCLSEPGSGSDASAMKTRAVKKGDKWVLNGVKNFITNGREAEIAIVYAIVDPTAKHKGIAAFIVESSRKGYSVAKTENKLGINGSSTAQIVLENVEVPAANMLGAENEGFKIAMHTLDGGRIGIACQAVGIARACVEEALKYSLERESFGRPIAELGAIQIHLADMAMKTDAARLLMRAAAHKKDLGLPHSRPAAQAKLFASETCMEVATRGIQVLGGYGYIKEYAMERHFRDAKITEIYEGTSEIQRIVIARNLVKEAGG